MLFTFSEQINYIVNLNNSPDLLWQGNFIHGPPYWNMAVNDGLFCTGYWIMAVSDWLFWRDIGTILRHKRQGMCCKYWATLNISRNAMLCEFIFLILSL